MKSGNLNFLEPSAPLQACNGTDLPITTTICAITQKSAVLNKCVNFQVRPSATKKKKTKIEIKKRSANHIDHCVHWLQVIAAGIIQKFRVGGRTTGVDIT